MYGRTRMVWVGMMVAVAGALTLGGCSGSPEEGSAERAGKAIDQSIDKAKDAAAKAAEAAKE